MDRREALSAREDSRHPRALRECDYLLGVFDEHRMGALRFKSEPNGLFRESDPSFATPPWTSLRALEQANQHLENTDAERDKRYSAWFNTIFKPGSSLGGARPKATVVDTKGTLWIAKFPSQRDRYDVGAWEILLHHLAQKSGVVVPPAQARIFGDHHHTFLTQRFDRTKKKERIHFSSALTMLQRNDGDDGQSAGASYLELAQFIVQYSAHPKGDLEQLWTRIVFFICVSNSDDHLRNHGFLLTPKGWILAPAYDMNPNPEAEGLLLNISETDNSQDLNLAREVAEFFQIRPKEADQTIGKVIKAVQQWRSTAHALGLPRQEVDRMAEAFRIADNVGTSLSYKKNH
jgi:serine/threonine-protein kinase HipA